MARFGLHGLLDCPLELTGRYVSANQVTGYGRTAKYLGSPGLDSPLIGWVERPLPKRVGEHQATTHSRAKRSTGNRALSGMTQSLTIRVTPTTGQRPNGRGLAQPTSGSGEVAAACRMASPISLPAASIVSPSPM